MMAGRIFKDGMQKNRRPSKEPAVCTYALRLDGSFVLNFFHLVDRSAA